MRLPPWLWRACRSKWTKRFLIASPFLLMISVVAFYGVANWWGRQCLQREIAAMRADGLPLTFEELFGPVPPAEEDVFQHPAIRREMEKADSDTRLWHLDAMLIPGLKKRADWEATPELGKLSDARLLCDPPRTGENEAEVAAELLQIIEPQSREFDACVEGLHRPVFHWGLTRAELHARCLPLNKLRYFAEDRARLRLAAGQTDLAATDVKTALAICERLGSAHGNMVAFISLALGEKQTSTVIWEGIRRGAWTERQLAEFQSQLGAVDLHRVFWDAVPTELIYCKQALEELPPDYHDGREWSEISSEFWEAGKNRATSEMKRLTEEAWEKAKPLGLKIREAVQDSSCIREWHVRFRDRGQLPGIHDYEEWKSIEGGEGIVRAIQEAHTRRDLLLSGIALERYRLKHGAVPEKLNALVPAFLSEVPKDIPDGQPLRYQVLPAGAPHVWSIWPSGKDEGGMPDRYDRRNTAWTTGQIPGLTEAVYNAR
jgi:hypothetical protein